MTQYRLSTWRKQFMRAAVLEGFDAAWDELIDAIPHLFEEQQAAEFEEYRQGLLDLSEYRTKLLS